MIFNKKTKFIDFVFYSDIFKVGEEKAKGLFEQLEKQGRPEYLCKKEVPKDLSDLTFGQLMTIATIKSSEGFLFIPAEVILGINKIKLLKAPAFNVIRFMLFVKKQLEMINEMFESIKYKPSTDEVNAGINQIDNGVFGTIDWYARRMGIIDHKYAEDVKWTMYFQAMKVDNTNANFEKRLREIIMKKK